ncbi:serine/threonine protein kinase [Actinomadura rugatobispora]|uniref:non-specific serine/threonine protein kinase n=1 Tax=Actinomadura rugatobispora TaxID=1994 RepID=A0ABW1A840_9ACTN|nr:hypothetical protein GCM10010200_017850 [Actinomadura rugatobispora]
MATAPYLVVAGHLDLARKLRDTGRFPAVFDVASATQLRDLSRSRKVDPPAAFIFAPEFDEDLPNAGVPLLADGLAASGYTVLVHAFYTQRGDTFDPRVHTTAQPMSMADLLTTLGALHPDLPAHHQADLQPEPPPEPWGIPAPTQAPVDQPVLSAPSAPAASPAPPAQPAPVAQAAIEPRQPPPEPVQEKQRKDQETPETPPGYGELSIDHRGNGSVTYRAVHEESGTVVALRVRLDGAETPPDEWAALERASRGDHVVTVLEGGRTATGRWYTASVHCPGGVHAPGQPLPIRDAVEIAVSVGKGLQALHDEGLVHGDLTPGRVLRGAEGPLLTGAATLRGLAAHSAPGVLEPVDLDRVDPGFACPEVLRRQAQTAASDVYGLGATLWALLAGHAPFAADDRMLEESVPRVPRDDVPTWLVDALAQAMASEPADRFPTARAFTDALEEGLRDVPAPAEPEASTGWEQLPGWLWGEPESEPRHETEQGHQTEPRHETIQPQETENEARRETIPQREIVRRLEAGRPSPARPSRRRPAALMAAVATLVLAGAGIGVTGLLSGSEPDEPPPQAVRPPVPSSTPTAVRTVKEFVPEQVRIVDGRVSIEVTWKDGSGGKASHYVVGGPTGRTPSTLASAPPGTAKLVVAALNPGVDYCLTVVAVVDVDRVAHAEPVCTRRVKRDG